MDVVALARYVEGFHGEGRYVQDKDFRLWLQQSIYYIQCYSLVVEENPFTHFPRDRWLNVCIMKWNPRCQRKSHRKTGSTMFHFSLSTRLSHVSPNTVVHNCRPSHTHYCRGNPDITIAKTNFEKGLVSQIQKLVAIAERDEEKTMEKLQGNNGKVAIDWED